jgi:hypothetical protein
VGRTNAIGKMAPIKVKTPTMKAAVVINTNSNVKKAPQRSQLQVKPQKKKKKKMQKMSKYLLSMRNPFAGIYAHIPDDNTSLSGLCTSVYNVRGGYQAADGVNAVNHSFGVIMSPYPGCAYTLFQQLNAGSAVMTDNGSTGTSSSYYSVQNATSLFGGGTLSSRVRCVSMGIRVVYEGTELNRSGAIFAGLGSNVDPPLVKTTTGTQMSVLSTFTGQTNPTLGTIRDSLTQVTQARIGDGAFEAHWKPAGVPSYQTYGTLNESASGTAGLSYTRSLFFAPQGGAGCEATQNLLVVVVDNDTTSAAAQYSNNYSFEMIWNWEILPDDPAAVAYTLSASPMDMQALQTAINGIQTSKVASYKPAGSSNSRF